MRVFVFALSLAGLVLGITTLAKSSPPFDPFAPYAGLLSADHAAQIVQTGQSCIFLHPDFQSCSFQPEDGVFSRVIVWIENRRIVSVAFEIINETLRVGDLVALWGAPKTPPGVNMFWPERDGVTTSALVPSSNRLNYMTSVQVVTFIF